MVEPVTESRCARCGQQPEDRVELVDETLECPDHGEQPAEHYQLFQFTSTYRDELRHGDHPPKKASRRRAPLSIACSALTRAIARLGLRRMISHRAAKQLSDNDDTPA